LLTSSCSTSDAARAVAPAEKSAAVGSILRVDSALDRLAPKDAQIKEVSGRFAFIQGPLLGNADGKVTNEAHSAPKTPGRSHASSSSWAFPPDNTRRMDRRARTTSHG
jgi:type IV secretory pathway TrbL component